MKKWMVGLVIIFSFFILQGCTYYDKDDDQKEFTNELSSTYRNKTRLIEL